MATTEDDHKQLHVAMLPWLTFGHIIPFLELSKFIAQKGHKVSFLSTTRNIQRLPTLPSHLSPLISLVKLTLPHVQELPQNAEATMDLRTGDTHDHLKRAFDGLQPEVTRFLEEESPDWIIYDFAPYWLPSVAAGLGISRAFFSIFNAWFIAFLGASPEGLINSSDTAEDFLTLRKWIPFPSKLCLKKHEAISFVGHFSGNGSGVSDAYRVGMVLKGSDCMFIRHSYEFEPQWLTLLEKLHQLLVVPVGLVPPETPINIGSEKDETWVPIKKWLDDQQKGHVVYIALGSEVMVSKTEMAELALGLELSRLPFFWALRKPVGSKELNLPDGFLERTRDRGVVWTSWVPQLQILNHESVGGFLTHCGWGSIVEGLMSGHPLIMLPFLVDQGLNARILVDKQVGIEAPRNEEDGSFTKESVARSVRSVVVDDEGKIFKANALEVSQISGDAKREKTYINHFIDYLEKKRGVVAINDET
ncbi:putative soyasaponin III rhamnosyltransferase [Helianthus annuus]|nr:putative soyasaponin III rhamnosyltransferase [Helianthus annuus]KAJ0656462.1 putative soyasaponin III rhamnosyltransferase [Helianthus annuus]KAJ0840557.1 putative soyasaponin III rhamnosyltransferase [Helianthus annuus]